MRRSLDAETTKYGLLVDPQRRRVYLAVRRAREGVTKEGVASELGISRTLATFHLERLLDAGLVSARFARREGATVGRPSKHYLPSDIEIALTLPDRRYQVAAEILSRSVVETASGGSAVERSLEIAFDQGQALGAAFARERRVRPTRPTPVAAVTELLEELGYEPHRDGDDIRLANCPFAAVVEPPFLICGLNKYLLDGVLAGSRARLKAVQAHVDGQCCAVIRSTTPGAQSRRPPS